MGLPERAFSTITAEEIEPQIGLLSFNRPDQLNALNLRMLDEIAEVFESISKDDAIRVLILTGKGRGFCSGADLTDAVTHQDSDFFSDAGKFLMEVQERYSALITGLRRIPQPVISAVNGPAAGGGFCIALASEIRIAVPKACFIASFANIGLSGGELGTSYFLPRLVGYGAAADILCTGRKVYAEEAEKIGLINRMVAPEDLLPEALSYARQMLTKSVGGLKLTKRVLEQNMEAPSLEAAISLENRNQAIMVYSKDFFNLVKQFVKSKE